ncbi:MAG: prepilin-type N-terminal cleavage/methylation domain-containing protein [Planctomycetes bacterium]|nr:prepilin-type N-terminal cleavage/methylation domain-containing protein [Planctomycetota bacterium]
MTSARGRSDDPDARAAAGIAGGGFSLLELLAVLAVLSLLGGIGAGVYAGMRGRYALPAASSHVAWTIRAARNFSLSAGVPSRVAVDPAEGTIEARGFETAAGWRFEDLGSPGVRITAGAVTEGAIGSRARVAGGIEVVRGKIGFAVAFGAGSYLDCGDLPRYAPPDGVAAEAWIYLAGAEGGTILRKEGSYSLAVTPSRAVEARIGTFVARSAPEVVIPFRWTFISAVFDGERLEIAVDGMARRWEALDAEALETKGGRRSLRASRSRSKGEAKDEPPPLPSRVPLSTTPLTISSPDSPFPGAIDEVVLRAAAEPRRYRLPSEVRILGWRKTIQFNGRGELDPLIHAAPVRIVLALGEREEAPAARAGSTSVGPPSVEGSIDGRSTFAAWAEARRREQGEGAAFPDEAQELEKLASKIPPERRRDIVVEMAGAVR